MGGGSGNKPQVFDSNLALQRCFLRFKSTRRHDHLWRFVLPICVSLMFTNGSCCCISFFEVGRQLSLSFGGRFTHLSAKPMRFSFFCVSRTMCKSRWFLYSNMFWKSAHCGRDNASKFSRKAHCRNVPVRQSTPTGTAHCGNPTAAPGRSTAPQKASAGTYWTSAGAPIWTTSKNRSEASV